MWMVCAFNGMWVDRVATLTVGRRYEVLNDSRWWEDIGVLVKNDSGDEVYYSMKRFVTVECWRDCLIDRILEIG